MFVTRLSMFLHRLKSCRIIYPPFTLVGHKYANYNINSYCAVSGLRLLFLSVPLSSLSSWPHLRQGPGEIPLYENVVTIGVT